jgi:flavorubredoxin
MKPLSDTLYYVGVNDRHKALFEGMWPLPLGVSYNSYLIVDQKVALVDTVDAAFFPQFLARIREVLGARPIDYLIINHMEPDHSGSIDLIRTYYPDITLVGNKKTAEMVVGYYGGGATQQVVADGDTLSLGTHTLRFALIPMVHWPETMVTFDESDGTLFSGDAFGCYGALDGGVTDRQLDVHAFWGEMRRYYANIVGKYAVPVQRALQKLQGLPVKRLCPTHGPVWEEQMQRVIDTYDRLSRYEAEPGLMVAYGSMYGHTEEMAEAVAQGAVEAGLKRVVVRDVSETHLSTLLADVFRYQGLVVGSPTYNGALHPAVDAFLNAVAARDVRGRIYGVIGSFTWASAAVKALTAWGEARGWQTVGSPIDNKQGCDADTLAACRKLGAEMAQAILAKN